MVGDFFQSDFEAHNILTKHANWVLVVVLYLVSSFSFFVDWPQVEAFTLQGV